MDNKFIPSRIDCISKRTYFCDSIPETNRNPWQVLATLASDVSVTDCWFVETRTGFSIPPADWDGPRSDFDLRVWHFSKDITEESLQETIEKVVREATKIYQQLQKTELFRYLGI